MTGNIDINRWIGGGVTKAPFVNFSATGNLDWSKDRLDTLNYVNICQVSPQLSCCSTYQIWTWYLMIVMVMTMSLSKNVHVNRYEFPMFYGYGYSAWLLFEIKWRPRIDNGKRSNNSMRSSEAYIRRQPKPSLVQIMPCRLVGAKALSEPMLPHCQLDSWEQTSVKF